MRKLLVLAFVGLCAQLVDGSLGMAYGVSSSTLLLASGYAAVTSSAAVHLAEVGTTLASGLAHWRLGNVDWRLVWRLGLPGAVGAFAGATVLSALSTEWATPWMAGILLVLGVYVLLRFSIKPWRARAGGIPRTRVLVPVGLLGGFVDATGGGGWGPVATPTLLSTGKVTPRQTIGSVDTSEFLVTVSASLGFLVGLGANAIPMHVVLPLLAGGLVAAPIAAWLVRVLPLHVLGVAVGWIVITTNTRTLLALGGVPAATRWATYAVITAVTLALLASVVTRVRRATSVENDEAALARAAGEG